MTDLVARSAARHAHVLLVEVPGHWRTRAMVERAVLIRGWSLAVSPADADLLAVCGKPGPRLGEAIEMVWHQMPGPRVRVNVQHYGAVEASLDEARARLLDTAHHRHDAHKRPAAADLLPDDEGMDHGGMDHSGHGDMDMSPCGIPLAQGGEDRNRLEMDVLNVRLGPVLPHWPAGLVLRCALQGTSSPKRRPSFSTASSSSEMVNQRQHPPGRWTTSCRCWLWPAGRTPPPRRGASATR